MTMRLFLIGMLALFAHKSLAGDTFTVEEFGYTGGTNPSEDSKAFDDALAAARAVGGAVVLGCGTYFLEDTLYLQTDDVLIGQGSKQTTIKFPVALTYHLTNGPNQSGYNNDEHIRLEGFTLECLFRENDLYHGLRLWGVDYPVVRDVLVRNVSVGHAILFRNCRYTKPGDIQDLSAENANFSVDPNYVPGGSSPSRPVIHFSGCKDLQANRLSVENARSSAPGLDRDAISCVAGERVELKGLRGQQINTLLDAGFNLNCVFEDFFAVDLDFIAVYSNNGNRGCVFRNGKFVNTDYGLHVRSAATGINEVEAFNLYQGFEFWNIGQSGTPRPGIWVTHNSPLDPTRAPHDNRFSDITFIDTNTTPGISRVVLEEHFAVGKNQYRNCTVETPSASTPIGDRVTGHVYGPNLQGLEEKVGVLEVDFSEFDVKAWQSEIFTIPNVSKILGFTLGLSTKAPTDPVQHINLSARAVSQNTFRLVVATTDNTFLSTKTTDKLQLTYRVLCE